MEEMRVRITQVMREENMTAACFADAIGIKRAAMSHISTGRNNPSLDVIIKILERFQWINPDWLIHGNGDMRRAPFGNITNVTLPDGGDMANNGVDSKTDGDIETMTDLFTQASSTAALPPLNKADSTPTAAIFTDEISVETPTIDKSRAEEVNKDDKGNEGVVKEIITAQEKPARKIDKLLILYSDQMYESFVPEKKNL